MRISELAQHIAQECAWELANLGFRSGQRVIWIFSGTYWQLYQSRKPENYERSAQVMNVVARHKFDDYLSPAKLSDFITTHVCFDSPERVLKDNATLYSVSEREAIFIEAPPGYDDLWRARWSPFFLYAQYRHAVRVIRMPIASFHRIADSVGDPENLTFVVNTARCGSTLLTQFFEATGRVVAISEPSALNIMSLMASKPGYDQAALNRIITSTVRMLCKPTGLGECGYVLKFTGPAMVRLPSITSLFPSARCLFMFRDTIKTAQSVYKLSEELPLLKLLWTAGRNSEYRLAEVMNSQGMPGSHYRFAIKHDLTFGFILATLLQRYYLDFRRDGIPITAVSYEDVIADPAVAIRRVLLFTGLTARGVNLSEEDCRRVLAGDSQRGTPLSSSVISRHKTLDYEEARSECEAFCDKQGMPRYGIPYVPPGTITTSDEIAELETAKLDATTKTSSGSQPAVATGGNESRSSNAAS